MEEILASIRRIISEDEAPSPPEGETAAAPEPALAEEALDDEVAVLEAEPEAEPEPVAAAPQPAPEPELEVEVEAEADDEDVLELTEPLAAAPEEIGDLDVIAPPSQSKPSQAPAMSDDDSLVSPPAAAAAASAFGQLASRIAMPPATQTLDEVVRELLRPLLKDWLDKNLAAIVQAKVEEEVERLARRRTGG